MGALSFEEIAGKVIDGEMSQQQGADALGIPRSTFVLRLNKEYPDRPKGVNIRRENRTPVSGRPKMVSYLEATYTDETLCRDLACRNCPLNKPGEKCRSSEGLIAAMLQKVSLKGSAKNLENV